MMSNRDSRAPTSRSMRGSSRDGMMSRPRDSYSGGRDYVSRDPIDDDYGGQAPSRYVQCSSDLGVIFRKS